MWKLAIILMAIPAATSSAAFAAGPAGAPASSPAKGEPIRVLIVTGGHPFEHDPFFAMFKGLADISYREVVQPEAQKWFDPKKAGQYDVMVWFDMWWGDVPDSTKENLLSLLKKGKPLVVLHHALNTYKDWPEADQIIGGEYYFNQRDGHPESNYTIGARFKVEIVDPMHPITFGMKDFEVVDETYGLVEVSPDVKPLLKTDHPTSSKLIGWTHAYGRSPVVFIQPGHGPEIYRHPSYRELVIRSIRWAAGRLTSDPASRTTKPAAADRDRESAHSQPAE